MSGIFKIDRKFTKQLHRRLLELKKQFLGRSVRIAPKNSELIPSITQLEEIILGLIWASTQHEEGRLSRFRVSFGEPFPADDLALIFKTPKRWCVEELRKLAPAVLPPDGHIGVWPRGEKGELHIWGIMTTGLVQITFEVIDPGRVTVSFPVNSKVAEVTGQRAGLISADWNSEALKIMAPGNGWGSNVSASPALSYFPIYATQEILRRMRLLGHGGALIFVQDGSKWERLVERPIFYGCELPLKNMTPISNFLKNELRKIENDVALDKFKKFQKGMKLLGDHQIKVFTGNAARSIAYLTAIDGATVLGQNFEVLAFGVKLRVLKARASQVHASTVNRISPIESDSGSDEVALDQEFRGTRHISAAQFVLNNPGSAAFVVSQDGGVTGLVLRTAEGESAPKLLAYRGLELLL